MAEVKSESVAQGEAERSPRQSGVLDKKALAAWKANADLHVLLIMRQNGVAKSVAATQAYHEGVDGLTKRLG